MRRAATALVLALFGAGAGLVVGAVLMRRIDRAAARVAPANLVEQATRTALTARDRLNAAFEEGERGAAEREADLRRRFDVPSLRQAAGR
ncbi:MAG: hypothetical protein ABR592_08775 [Nitriliruptorales bacterium]